MWIDSGNSGTYSIFDQYFTWIVVCMILSILGFFLSESGLLICYVVGLGFRKIALMFNCIPKSQKQDSEPSTPNQKSKPCFDITADQVRFQNKAQQYQQSTIFAPNTQLFSSNSNSRLVHMNSCNIHTCNLITNVCNCLFQLHCYKHWNQQLLCTKQREGQPDFFASKFRH